MPKATAKYSQGQTLYDVLMAGIHGDLMASKLQESLKPRAGESDEAYRMRLEEYAAAFYVMDAAIQELTFDADCDDEIIRAVKKQHEQAGAQSDEKQTMQNIEDQFSTDNE